MSTLGFEKATFEVPESSKLISLPVLRSGELDSDIYVDCSTTTSLGNHRHRNVLVKLAAGESHGFCDLEMGDDDDLLPPSVATLRVRLANPSSSDVEIAAGFSEATVRFVSDERERESIVVVSMARGQVHTEEPSSSDACILVLIGIVRSGDVTSPLTTSVRVSVVADTALGNRVDFDDSAAAVQASQVQFEAGARLAHVRVPIMYDEVREESSSGGGGERRKRTNRPPGQLDHNVRVHTRHVASGDDEHHAAPSQSVAHATHGRTASPLRQQQAADRASRRAQCVHT